MKIFKVFLTLVMFSIVLVTFTTFCDGEVKNILPFELKSADLLKAATCGNEKFVLKTAIEQTLAYITPWNNAHEALKRKRFSHVSPVWYTIKIKQSVDVDKKHVVKIEIDGRHNVNSSFIHQWRAENPKGKLMPRFLIEVGDISMYTLMVTSRKLQNKLTKELVKEIDRFHYDGLVLEMTNAWAAVQAHKPQKRMALNQFIIDLADVLHENSKNMFLVVQPPSINSPHFGSKDFAAVHAVVDGFSLMTYDFSRGRAGPNSPLDWVEHSILSLVEEVVPHAAQASDSSSFEIMRKIFAGVPLYGYMYTASQVQPIRGNEFLKLLEQIQTENSLKNYLRWDAKAAEHFLAYEHDLDATRNLIAYYPTDHFLQQRVKLFKRLGTSMSLWELGQALPMIFEHI